MKFFIIIELSFKWATAVQATYCHLVDQSFSNQIFLSRLYFSGASWTFSFEWSARVTKCMSTRMQSLRSVHQVTTICAIQMFRIDFIDKLIFILLDRCIFVLLNFWQASCTSNLPHKRVKFIFNIFKHNYQLSSFWFDLIANQSKYILVQAKLLFYESIERFAKNYLVLVML